MSVFTNEKNKWKKNDSHWFIRIINDMNIMQAKIKIGSQCEQMFDPYPCCCRYETFVWCDSRINYLCACLFKMELTNRITTHSFSFRKTEPAVLSGIVLVEWILANQIEHLHCTHIHIHLPRFSFSHPNTQTHASECFQYSAFHYHFTLWKYVDKSFIYTADSSFPSEFLCSALARPVK